MSGLMEIRGKELWEGLCLTYWHDGLKKPTVVRPF